MEGKRITVEIPVVKVIILTEDECEKQLQYLREIQNVIQVYAGEINEPEMHVAIRELIKIGRMIQSTEELLKKAVEARIIEERLLLIDTTT